jgi:prepilin-type processing-associated H-X9-DG protein/prepilin-type N-terminal cleavage/methylation domain-containing protein
MKRRGISLVELLVVLSILALLAAITLAGVQAVRAAAARAQCQSHLRQLVTAAQNYHATHRQFPNGVAYPFSKSDYDIFAKHAGVSWHTNLLPYLEQDSLYGRAWAAHSANPSGNSPDHDSVASHPLAIFRCSADARSIGRHSWEPAASQYPPWGLTNFVGVSGTDLQGDDGVFHSNLRVSANDITDGTSNTVMIGERPTGQFGYGSSWYSGWGTLRYFEGQLMPVSKRWANSPTSGTICPTNIGVFQAGKYDNPCDHHHFWSLHSGGANFAFADGSVRFLSYSADAILPALATRAGGEVASPD